MSYIEERGKDTWRLVVNEEKDDKGNRIRHTKTFHGGQREAKRALESFATEVAQNEYLKVENLYVSDFLKLWLKDYATQKLEYQTHRRYEQLLRIYAFDNIGKYKLHQIKAPHFHRLYSKMENMKLSGTTILQLHRILHKAFNSACEWQLLSRNPLEFVTGPSKDSPDIPSLDEKQATYMLDKAYQELPYWLYVLIAVAVLGGLRRGELLALRWKDVNFENDKVFVNQSLQRIYNEGLSFKEPKTKKSKRPVSLPTDVMDLLKILKTKQDTHKEILKEEWVENDLVFAGTYGKPRDPEYVSRLFVRFIKKHDLPTVTLHGLRHSAASILINKGINPKAVSTRLGHSTVQITLNTYCKFPESADREAAEKMSGIVPKNNK